MNELEKMGQAVPEVPADAKCGGCFNFDPSPACGACGFCRFADGFVWCDDPADDCGGYDAIPEDMED